MFRLKKKKNYYNTKYIISAVWFCSVFTPIFGFMKKIIYLVQYCKEFYLIIDLNIDICIYMVYEIIILLYLCPTFAI
jgi:hypothetical protein